MKRRRSTVDTMILVFTFVVAFSILATGAVSAVVMIRNPTVDISSITDKLAALITGMLGALLGLLAGKHEDSDSS